MVIPVLNKCASDRQSDQPEVVEINLEALLASTMPYYLGVDQFLILSLAKPATRRHAPHNSTAI